MIFRFSLPCRLLLSLGLPPIAAAIGGCGGGAPPVVPSSSGDQVSLTIEHQPCDTGSSSAVKIDTNGDGRPDIVRVMAQGREVCRVVDLNLDGRPDSYIYFDASGAISRRESDFDRDGNIDEIAEYAAGTVVRKSRETNLDGRLDTWDFYDGGKLTRRLRDSDGNGRVDQWWTWPHADKPDCPVIASDRNGDGQPDPGEVVDTCAPPADDTAAGPAASTSAAGSTAGAAPAASAAAAPASSAAAAPASGPAPAPVGSANAGGSR